MIATSSRHPVFLGVSHKIYLDPPRTKTWSHTVAQMVATHSGFSVGAVSLVVLPALPSLSRVIEIFAPTTVAVGAQDLFYEDRGAFTGAVSGQDLAMLGCCYAEIGHAERRAMGDSDNIVQRKLAAALRNHLTPILCIGETEPGEGAVDWCLNQLDAATAGFSHRSQNLPLVVAYEPVWAIGQAKPASLDHVRLVSSAVRGWFERSPAFSRAKIIYGGSAGPGTLSTLGEAVDGLFLGRFAHDPAMLAEIFDEAAGLSMRLQQGRMH